jgi:hypothetical protein
MGYRLRRISVGLLASSAALLTGASAANATYNGTTAASYADRYAINNNGAYYTFSNDCTNAHRVQGLSGNLSALTDGSPRRSLAELGLTALG